MSVQEGHAAVTEFLEREGVPYEIVEHERTQTAAEEAAATGMPPAGVAKTVVLRDDDTAIDLGDRRLDLHKVKRELGSKGLRLVTEHEMAGEFSDFEVGALPPFGPMLHALELVDERLLNHDRVLCGGGDHEHGVLVDPHDLVHAGQARVADVCED